jgi:hypothetical protein
MPHYSCLLLDDAGNIKATETLHGNDDAEVLNKAREYLIAHRLVPAVEVRLEDRSIGKLTQQRAAQ